MDVKFHLLLLLFLLAGTLPVIGTPTGKEFIEEMLFGYEHTYLMYRHKDCILNVVHGCDDKLMLCGL